MSKKKKPVFIPSGFRVMEQHVFLFYNGGRKPVGFIESDPEENGFWTGFPNPEDPQENRAIMDWVEDSIEFVRKCSTQSPQPPTE